MTSGTTSTQAKHWTTQETLLSMHQSRLFHCTSEDLQSFQCKSPTSRLHQGKKHKHSTNLPCRLQPFWLTVALGVDGSAHGTLFLDDGVSLHTVENRMYDLIEFEAHSTSDGSQGSLSSHVKVLGWPEQIPPLSSVDVLGVSTAPSTVTVNGDQVSFVYDSTNQVSQQHCSV